jgi:hypothetical protein
MPTAPATDALALSPCSIPTKSSTASGSDSSTTSITQLNAASPSRIPDAPSACGGAALAGWNKHPALPDPARVHAALAGTIPGWQLTLMAVTIVLLAATVVAIVYPGPRGSG